MYDELKSMMEEIARGLQYQTVYPYSYGPRWNSATQEYELVITKLCLTMTVYASQDYGVDNGNGTYNPLKVDLTKIETVNAAIDKNGKLKGKRKGTVVITAKNNGKTITKTVKVK